jgi:chorismate--pyruvate lyase
VAQPWRTWLLDSGSLTQNLKNLAPNRFSVQVLHTGLGRASLSEACTLNIPFREQIYIREVALCIDKQPQVFARSVIPRSTLTGPERQLLFLRNKPLGEFLFKHKKMSRGKIEVKQGLINNQSSWARRSIFNVNNKPLLVSEFFLPSLFTVK